ncbi:MAG: sunset domain-containing protein [Thermomicrobiales bacterium]
MKKMRLLALVVVLLLALTACGGVQPAPTASPTLRDRAPATVEVPSATVTATATMTPAPTATVAPTATTPLATRTATPPPPTATTAPTATVAPTATPTIRPPTPTSPPPTATRPAPNTPTATAPVAVPASGSGRAAPQGRNCPPGYPIKGNQGKEWIYHTPQSRSYGATIPEDCFATEQDAKDAGYRPAKD